MGLPARQRRVLGRIEGALRGSDPRLAAIYSIFARLTRDEEMPRIEQLRHGIAALFARLRHQLAFAGARSFGRLGRLVPRRLVPRQRAVLLFPLALCLAIASIVFAVRAGNGPTCSPVMPLAASSKHVPVPQSKICRNQPPMGFYGRLVRLVRDRAST
jgi:hypothetical protein